MVRAIVRLVQLKTTVIGNLLNNVNVFTKQCSANLQIRLNSGIWH